MLTDPGSSSYVHATAVVIGEAGLLIRGPAGAGKSSLALRLIDEAHRRGRFARLVGDDRVSLSATNGGAVVRPHPAIAGRIERRTRPVATLPHEPGCVIRLVVELVETRLARLSDEPLPTTTLLDGIAVPLLRLEARTTGMSCLFVLQELACR